MGCRLSQPDTVPVATFWRRGLSQTTEQHFPTLISSIRLQYSPAPSVYLKCPLRTQPAHTSGRMRPRTPTTLRHTNCQAPHQSIT